MEPRAPSNEYFDVSLPHPGYDAGAAIELYSAAEGSAFRLRAVGVSPMELLTRDLTLDPASDPSSTGPGRPGWRRCRSACASTSTTRQLAGGDGVPGGDRGSLTVDKTLHRQSDVLRVSGFPTGTVVRGTTIPSRPVRDVWAGGDFHGNGGAEGGGQLPCNPANRVPRDRRAISARRPATCTRRDLSSNLSGRPEMSLVESADTSGAGAAAARIHRAIVNRHHGTLQLARLAARLEGPRPGPPTRGRVVLTPEIGYQLSEAVSLALQRASS
jgi:hypothetical protein